MKTNKQKKTCMNNIHTAPIPFYFNLHSFNVLLSYFPIPWLVVERGVQLPATSTSAFFLISCPFKKGEEGVVRHSQIIWQPSPGDKRIRKNHGPSRQEVFNTIMQLPAVPKCGSCAPPFIPYAAANHLSRKMYLVHKGVGHERYDQAGRERLYTCCMWWYILGHILCVFFFFNF